MGEGSQVVQVPDSVDGSFGHGPWEYRHICNSCGHAVKPPKNRAPCSRCGGDFGPRISMRKLFLEPEKPMEFVEVEYIAERTWLDALRELLGFQVVPRVEIVREKRRPPRRWRWQSHAEVEEGSGVYRQEEFMHEE
ncbi:MAG: hypothetical protein ACRC46_05955 [Thermoguttaceae bacterium]